MIVIKINTIIHGDCIEQLKRLPDNSVDSIVTDPPYELGFLNKSWDRTGIAYNVELWRECLRVLKYGGHMLSFGGTRTYHRMVCAIEDAGFEIRDQIQWLYSSGFPKSHDISKAIDKKLGKKRELISGTPKPKEYSGKFDQRSSSERPKYGSAVSEQAKEWDGWGTALKPAYEPIVLARKSLNEKTIVDNVLKWGTGGINIDECRVEYKDEDENLVNVKGRFPANVIMDEEVGNLLDSQNNGASRFFYCPKASKKEREGNNHPTVKPIRLMEYLVTLVTPKDGVVLDPFAGSGSTLVAAKNKEFNYIGIEKEEKYIEIINRRLVESE